MASLPCPNPAKTKSVNGSPAKNRAPKCNACATLQTLFLPASAPSSPTIPLLTDRSGLPRRRRLLRVILDTHLRLSPKARIVQTADDDLLVFTAAQLKSPKARKLQNAGVELIEVKRSRNGLDLSAVFKDLGRRDILSVLLEAGPSPQTPPPSLRQPRQQTSPLLRPKIAGDSQVPFINPFTNSMPPLRVHTVRQIGPDVTLLAYPRKSPL